MVVSAVGVEIINSTFRDLIHPGVIFNEGACGANAGDYTEGLRRPLIWLCFFGGTGPPDERFVELSVFIRPSRIDKILFFTVKPSRKRRTSFISCFFVFHTRARV